MTRRTASCSCGQLRAYTVGEPDRVSVCHCLACQRRTGSPFGAQARFRAANVTIDGESRSYERRGDGGGVATFHFCGTCGATVFYTLDGLPDDCAIPLGAFADPTFPRPSIEIYTARRHPWVQLPDDIEHWD